MLDIRSLEKRWLRYKIKRFIPFIGIIFIVFLLIISAIYLMPYSKAEKEAQPVQKKSLTKPLVTNTTQLVNETNNTFILEPSMEFMQNLSSQDTITDTSLQNPIVNQKITSNKQINNIPKETVIALEMPQEPSSKSSSSKNAAPLISKTDNKIDVENLESRFKQNPNASLGLFIARYYYDQSNYAQSYNYALKTNNINDKLDESWIIFAKSLVKLGKSEQAKKILKIYIDQSNSDSAKSLLYSIEKGTFK